MATRSDRAAGSTNVFTDALLGLVAGTVGTLAMSRLDWFMFKHEDPGARGRTQAVRPRGAAPAPYAADKIANALGGEFSNPRMNPGGMAIHYSLGMVPATLYGALSTRHPAIRAGRGTLYGLGLFLIQDELLNAVSGLGARPGAYPWQAHARGLIAHLVYGLVTDITLEILRTATQDIRTSHRLPTSSAGAEPAGSRLAM